MFPSDELRVVSRGVFDDNDLDSVFGSATGASGDRDPRGAGTVAEAPGACGRLRACLL